MKDLKGGITAPAGYQSSGISCGIKESAKKDLALIYSEVPAQIAGVFTTNQVQAAPVKLSKKRVKNGMGRAIIINSGNANACTGQPGLDDANRMTEIVADRLGLNKEQVLIASTGVIGQELPMNKIEPGIDEVVVKLSNDDSMAAEAILTTDTFRKERALSFTLPLQGKEIRLGGMAKGSGMIHPNMATMLGFITTDLAISKDLLKEALREAIEVSFNRISVDGDQSTNDSVFLLANGEAGNNKITNRDQDFFSFVKALKKVSRYLAKEIVADGEGATKFITINVVKALSEEQAEKIARKVANSNLVKTACFGSDPNWGRILAAIGSCATPINEDNLLLKINGKILFEDGSPYSKSSNELKDLMKSREIVIDIILNCGEYSTVFWTSDLSYEYVKINAEYNI